ncbi:GNAT family N-acetyltransferase [Microbacterium sp. LWH10-1.2]|uniref:GNAT family N-acetyltransferase n=1 Tax=Microbacterium sp. LWH10-1.2 TaxID=3135255 RepID=UPI00313896D2
MTEVLRARRGAVPAEATAGFSSFRADEAEALWGALRRHTLELSCGDGDRDARRAAVGEVLDVWLDDVLAVEEPGDEDSSCTVRLPSDDTDLVLALLTRGFAPVTIDAVRRLSSSGRSDAAHGLADAHGLGDGALLRAASASDTPALAAFDALLLSHEADFGAVFRRPGAEQLLLASMTDRLRSWPDWTWLIEQDGAALGYVHAFPEAETPGSPPRAYLDAMYLAPDARGAGLGRRVIDAVHGILAGEGTGSVRLDYSVANPQSGPFWSRLGYRPVTTTWQRRPSVR